MTRNILNLGHILLLGVALEGCAGKAIDFKSQTTSTTGGAQNNVGGASNGNPTGGAQSNTAGTTNGGEAQSCPNPGNLGVVVATNGVDPTVIEYNMVSADGGTDKQYRWVLCDPFASTGAVKLGQILGVAQAADSTLYVIDMSSSNVTNVYVSVDGVLQRQRIIGESSGGFGANGNYYLIDTDGPAAPFMIRLDVGPNGPIDMGVVQGKGNDVFEVGQAGETLTLVPTSSIAAMPVVDTRPAWLSVVQAHYANGVELQVLEHNGSHGHDGTRVFYGFPPFMMERTISLVTPGSMESGTRTPSFDVEGHWWSFTYSQNADALCALNSIGTSCATSECKGTYPGVSNNDGLKYFCVSLAEDPGSSVGLVDIPKADVQNLIQQACSTATFDPNDAGIDTAMCTAKLAYPILPGMCGYDSQRQSPVILLKGDGTAQRVLETEPGCPDNGDGFYLNSSGEDIVLCAKTCATMVQNNLTLRNGIGCSAALCIY